MTLSQLLHLDDGEFPALRAQIEAKPMPRVGVPATTRRPLRIDEQARAVDVLFGLHLDDGTLNTVPLTQIDWSARLAEDFGAVDSELTRLASNTARTLLGVAHAEYNAWTELYDWCGNVVNAVGIWRREVAELAPFAAKAEVA